MPPNIDDPNLDVMDELEDDDSLADELNDDPEPESSAEPDINDDDKPMTRGQARQILEAMQTRHAAPPADPVDAAPIGGPTDQSAYEVRRQIRLIDTMVNEVRAKNPDCPVQVLDALRNELDRYTTYDDLAAIQKKGNHQTWSDAQMMKLMREGKYMPKNLRGKGNVLASDARSGAVSAPTRAPRQLSQHEKDAEAMERSVLEDMGVKFDQDDLTYLATGGTALR